MFAQMAEEEPVTLSSYEQEMKEYDAAIEAFRVAVEDSDDTLALALLRHGSQHAKYALLAEGPKVVSDSTLSAFISSDHEELSICLVDEIVKMAASPESGIKLEDAIHCHHLSVAAGGGMLRLVAKLIGLGAVTTEVNSFGGTAIGWAAQNAESEMIDLLVSHKADPNVADTAGMTPLLMLIEVNQPREGGAEFLAAVDALIKHADLKEHNQGERACQMLEQTTPDTAAVYEKAKERIRGAFPGAKTKCARMRT
jgi:hypothetical protein